MKVLFAPHITPMNLINKTSLKKTYWYKMIHHGKGLVSPQIEEGITECKWINKEEFRLIKENTFKSIEHILSLI